MVVTKPTGVADGELMIAITNGPIGTVTAPAGWTHLGSFVSGTATQSNAYKKIASSEPANYTFTFPSSSACRAVIISFMGARDVLFWDAQVHTTTTTPTTAQMGACRDAVAYSVLCWVDSASNTVTADFGNEDFDSNAANTGSTIFRGFAGYTYGPGNFGVTDIINTGDAMPSTTFTISGAPTGSIAWSFLVDNKAPDTEQWSSTNGDFDVELELDKVELNTLGTIASTFRGDITSKVSAITSRGDTVGEEDDKLVDGLASTKWHDAVDASWVQYDFGSGNPKTIRRYRITSGDDNNVEDPMDWTLQGSNNGTDYTVLDTRQNESFAARGEVQEFRVTTPGSYRYYKIDITSNRYPAGAAGTTMAEFRLSEIDIWEDITSYVQAESKIRITRGFQGASGRHDYSRAYVTLKNTDGRFSMRNQYGAYFGAIQRNTQMRISKAFGTKSLQLQGAVRLEGTDMAGDCVRCALTNSLAITGDIDIRVDLHPESWRDEQMLCGLANGLNSNEGWSLRIDDSGVLHLTWHDGTTFYDVSSEFPVPQAGRQAVRATLDVNNGASGHTVTFYTAPTIAGSWTQLGDAITGTGTTSLAYEGGAISVGHVQGRSQRGIHGLVYHFELYNGIAGTAVTDVDFTALTNGAHSFTDSNSNRWVTINNAVVSNRRYRFHGEVAEWPLYWDTTGEWVEVSATAGGVQKRLERSVSPVSAFRRHHTKGIIPDPGAFERSAEPAAYWPCEDLKDTIRISSGLPGKPHMEVYGAPEFASFTDFQGSDALPKLNNAKFGGRVAGNVAGYADIRWLLHVPTSITNGSTIVQAYTTGGSGGPGGAIVRWELKYNGGTDWVLNGYNELDSSASVTSGLFTMTMVGEHMYCQLILDEVGSDVTYTVRAYDPDGASLGSSTANIAATTMGRVYRVNINDDSTNKMNEAYVGHIAVYDSADAPGPTAALNAHIGENAVDRVKRLCDEERVEFRYVGAGGQSALMGYQDIDSAFSLMSTNAVSDDGYLIDPLDAFGIEYRTNRALYNQTAHLTLDYTAGELSGELTPSADDSHIVNDFTASRGQAGSARFRRDDGPLSVNQPPDGVDTYEQSQSYSFAHEGQCVQMASWQVHKGTLDEERYPRIEVALENLRVAADTTLGEAILTMDVGKRVDITNIPDFLPAEDIRQIVVGYEESFDKFQHGFRLNCIPERAFEIAEYDNDFRFDQTGSTLYQDISTSATSLTVSNTNSRDWSSSAADFDVRIDGEQVTVTAVAYASDQYSTDSFNRANSATVLGSTDGGTVSAWTQDLGTWGINGNQAYVSASASSYATITGSADFEEVSVTVPTWPSGTAAIIFRAAGGGAAENDFVRWGGVVGSLPVLDFVVASVVTRTETPDSGASDFTLAAGDTLSARAHGSVVEVFHNGILALCVSETDNETRTQVGLRTTDTAVRFENFTWIKSEPRQTWTVTRGVNGTSAAHKAGAELVLWKPPYRGL